MARHLSTAFLCSATLHAAIIAPLLGWSRATIPPHRGASGEIRVMLLTRSEAQADANRLSAGAPPAAIRTPSRAAVTDEGEPEPAAHPRQPESETRVVDTHRDIDRTRHTPHTRSNTSRGRRVSRRTIGRNQTLARGTDQLAPTSVSTPASTWAAPPVNPPAPDAGANIPPIVSVLGYRGGPPRPSYPPAALRRNQAGRVVIRATVSAAGTVASATIRESSGYTLLDDAALNAVRATRFMAYRVDGRPRTAMVDIPFDFRR